MIILFRIRTFHILTPLINLPAVLSCLFCSVASSPGPPHPPSPQKIPPKPEKWTSGGQISLLRMSKLHRQIHLSDTARGVKTGGGYLVKTSRPGDGDHLRGGNETRIIKYEQKQEKFKINNKTSYSMSDSRRVPTRRLPHTGSLGDYPF